MSAARNATMQPMLVRARLGSGVGHAPPWGISLDGLLASQIRENEKAVARESGTDYIPYDSEAPPRDLDLPLARCTHAGGDDWHWAATFAWPEGDIPGPHVQYWSARPDQHALSQISDNLPAHLAPRQGRYRAAVMPLPLTIARALTWRAVGDPDKVVELLAGIPAIGKKRAAGNGMILDWTVNTCPDGDFWEYSHLHPDGRLGRTAPVACLEPRSGVDTGGIAVMGVRPPYMHRATRTRAFLPAS